MARRSSNKTRRLNYLQRPRILHLLVYGWWLGPIAMAVLFPIMVFIVQPWFIFRFFSSRGGSAEAWSWWKYYSKKFFGFWVPPDELERLGLTETHG